MNINYKKLIEELKKERKLNSYVAKEAENDFTFLRLSGHRTKWQLSLYTAQCLLLMFLILGAPALVSALPLAATIGSKLLLEIALSMVVGVSFGVVKIVYKILGWDKKAKEIANAKTEEEKYEAKIECCKEKEKAEANEKIMDQAIGILNVNYHKTKLNNNLSSKDIIPSKEETEKSIADYSITLKEKQEELDMLTTKSALLKNRPMTNSTVNVESIYYPFLVGVGLLSNFMTVPGMTSLLYILGFPTLLGFIENRCLKKDQKAEQKIFKKINRKLGKNAVAEIASDGYDEQEEIKEKINDLTSSMAILEAEKREKMELLQIINKNNTNKEEYSKGKIKSGNQQVFEALHLDENYVSSNEPNKILIK